MFTFVSPKRRRDHSSEENQSDVETRPGKKQKISTKRSPLRELSTPTENTLSKLEHDRRLWSIPVVTRLHPRQRPKHVFVEIPTHPPPCLVLPLHGDEDGPPECETSVDPTIVLGSPIRDSEDEGSIRPRSEEKQQPQKKSVSPSNRKSRDTSSSAYQWQNETRLTPILEKCPARLKSTISTSSGRTHGKARVSYANFFAASDSDTEDVDDSVPTKMWNRRAQSDSEAQYHTDDSDSTSDLMVTDVEDRSLSSDEETHDVRSSNEDSPDTGSENGLAKLTKSKLSKQKKTKKHQTAANERRGLDLNLPPLPTIPDIFEDITLKALKLGLRQVLRLLEDRPLRVGTMCSGTESPLLALRLVDGSLERCGEAGLKVDHKFSAEIEAFKQAYIERNCHPPFLFRDVREFAAKDGTPPTGTTVYGSRFPVPCDIDLLIAGSSCVDFSNLNNNPNDKGESNDTFLAIIAYVEYSRPPMVILENVIKDQAWKRFQKEFNKIGYAMHIEKVDTKDYYLPHTRQRKYMLCLDKKLYGASAVGCVHQWGELMQAFRRRASSPITSFLLASDDARYLRMALGTGAKDLIPKNWEACRRRHEKARAEKNLGQKRPITTLLPDHSDRRFLQNRPQRDQEVLDIVHLRHAVDGIDSLYKTRPVDLSQNVDRVDRANWGITGCLTPSGMPFVTDQCRRMTGHEALRLQGIDIDSVSFTSETDANLRDLAGNAMTSTVVGPAILSALIATARHKSLKSYKHIAASRETPAMVPRLCGADQLCRGDVTTNQGAPDWLKMLEDAHKSQRNCVCEGQTEISQHPILICKECQHTACQRCAGNPKHAYERGLVQRASRLSPSDFQTRWRERLPVRLRLSNLPSFGTFVGDAIDTDIKRQFLNILCNLCAQDFVLYNVRRSSYWVAQFRSSKYRLELILGRNPTWYLFALPDRQLPANSKLRRILEQPIARLQLDPGRNPDLFSLESNWEWHIPFQRNASIEIRKSEELLASWRCRLGLDDFQDEMVPKRLEITLSEDDRSSPFRALCGYYEVRQDCGTACDSLYKKVDSDRLFFFLDPDPISDAAHDRFVFSTNPERPGVSERHHTLAHVKSDWRPWLNQGTATTATSEGHWISCRSTTLAPVYDSIVHKVPNSSFDEFRGIHDCHDATTIMEAEATVDPDTISRWAGVHQINLNDKALLEDFAWLFAGVPELRSLRKWRLLAVSDAACASCYPKPPPMKWLLKDNKVVIQEDHLAAALYERLIKSRPMGFVVQSSVDKNNNLRLRIGVSLRFLCHQAVSRLDTVERLEWNFDSGYFEPARGQFALLRLRSNQDEVPHAQLAKFKLPLRSDQLRSLTWMKQQERGVTFKREEIEEAILPAFGWKTEVKASATIHVQGGVLADEPSYGKTITSLALINEEFIAKTPKEILRDFKQPHTGLINTAATLIVTPSHLTDQWEEELGRFCGGCGTTEVLVIRNIAKLKAITATQLCLAKVVIVPWMIFTHEVYAAQLAIFAAYPQVSSVKGREFKSWQEHAIPQLPTHVPILQKDGIKAFRAAMIDKLNSRMEDQDFVGTVPSRRLKGAKYTATDNKHKSGVKSKTTSKPDGIISSKGKDDNWKSLQFPVLHMFRWNRLVVDEFSYLLIKEDDSRKASYRDYSPAFTSVVGLQAEKRWVLSGTPPLRDFLDVKRIALFLNVTLGIDSFAPEAMSADNFKNLKDQLSAHEKFRSYQEMRSHAWHQHRHTLAQRFLDRFARQNAAEVNDIDCFQSINAIRMDFDQSIIHEELYSHLTRNEMDTSQRAEHKTTDEGDRINFLLSASSSAEHTLLRSCAVAEQLSPRDRITKREKELDALKSKLANTVAIVEASKRKCKESDLSQYEQWKLQTLGDAESNEVMRSILQAKSGLLRDDSKNFRKHLDEAQAAGRAYTAQLRSLRRYQNINRLRLGSGRCNSPCCAERKVPTDSLRILIACGHSICKTCLDTKDASAGCPVLGCEVDVMDQHIRSADYFGKDSCGGKSFGEKLDAIVKLIKSLPSTDQVLLFVQGQDLIEGIEGCLDGSSISFLSLGGNTSENLKSIRDFQHTTGGAGKKVLILSLAGEQASGLNLTNANHIVFLSPLLASTQYDYEATMKQAVRRVRRTGQKRPVFVHRFVALNTIDVDILERREKLLTKPIWSQDHPRKKSLPEPSRDAKSRPEPSKVVRDKKGNFALVPVSQLGSEFVQGENFSSLFPFRDIEENDEDV